MPLTDDGFIVPTLEDVRGTVFDEIRQIVGQEVDLAPHTPFGKIAELWAQDKLTMEQELEDVYDANFAVTATGVSLDRRASNDNIQRYQAQYAEATLAITGEPGYVVPANTEFDTDNGDAFFTDVDCQLGDDGKGSVLVRSEDAADSANVPANSITEQAEPVDEIDTVTNPQGAAGGADLETDFELRQRILNNNNAKEGPTDNGIKTAVLNVPGVISCTVHDNRTNEIDKQGTPPHAYHIYVLGGSPQDIADKLAVNVGAGTQMIGNQVYEENIGGSTIEVRFDVATDVTAHFKLDITTTGGYSLEAVQQTIIDWLSSFPMGATIPLNKLYGDIYNNEGIVIINSLEATLDGQNWSNDYLKLDQYQTAVTSEENIEVNSHDTD